MKLSKTDQPIWHPLRELDSVRQFMMVNGSHTVLNNWDIKYLDLRMDMRSGYFLIKEGNSKNPAYLKLEEE